MMSLGTYAAEHGISAQGQLLGYLGETALYNATNFNWGMNVNTRAVPFKAPSTRRWSMSSSALPTATRA